MRDVVTDFGRAAEQAEDEARHRVVVLDREVGAEALVEVVDRERPVDLDRVLVHLLDRLIGEVELVLDLADDLLQQILKRDDALHLAVLVDDDRHVLVRAAELGQERREILRLGDDVRRPDDVLDLHLRHTALSHRVEQIAHVEDADDVVERPPVDRIARERRVHDGFQALLGRQVDRERHDLGTGHHHVRGLLVREVKDLVEHLLLLLLDLAMLGRLGDEHAELRLGEDIVLAAGRLQPEPAQHDLRRSLQYPDQRAEEREERAHGCGHGERRPLGVLKCDAFWNELADHDVQVREDQVGDRYGERGRHQRIERFGECVLAERTDTQ